jgi:hypothetical protein
MASPCTPYLLYLLLLLLFLSRAHCVAAGTAGDDVTNNLFTDVAPLLALFGERFAQQFLSDSYSVYDHVLFAVAPLGIITAFVSAIRVAGPGWLKALVGRARENIAQAELEVMSSVSEEVCEVWNGKAIVRVTGRPQVKKIIHIPLDKDDVSPESFITVDKNTWSPNYSLERDAQKAQSGMPLILLYITHALETNIWEFRKGYRRPA